MEKEKLNALKIALKQKYSKHKKLINDTFMNSLQIILDKNAKISAEEFLHILNNGEDKIIMKDDNHNIVIDFSGEEIVVENHCIVSSVSTETMEPMHINCSIPERFNEVFAYKDEISTFIMPKCLTNANIANKIINSGAVSSIARALGVDVKTITQKQIALLFKCLLGDLSGGIVLGQDSFDINFGMIETDFCDIAYTPEEGLIIDYDDGKVKTYKTYFVNLDGNVTYTKQELNFYNMTQLEAVDYRCDAEMKGNDNISERLLKLKDILTKGTSIS